jgi:hypothetical protein
MFIRFTSVDSQGRVRNCSWYVASLEFGLDALSTLVSKGSSLLQAELIEGEQRITLSVDALNGTLISPFIQAIEVELEQILRYSISPDYLSETFKTDKS